MNNYKKTNATLWNGRTSGNQLYLHEKIQLIDLENEELPYADATSFSILGYACDEGVKRNQGRIGAAEGPDCIRKMLSPLSNHFREYVKIIDAGDIVCNVNDLEYTQSFMANKISQLLTKKYFNIILGGGHDLAYAHYNGIKTYTPDSIIGIINLDAHFDLRKITTQGNSGTPFYQIAKESDIFKYLCLGIQQESNTKELYKTAKEYDVKFIENTHYTLSNSASIKKEIDNFASAVDYLYLTIDLDGFSSSLAPGVSAPSPMGFSLDIALKSIAWICDTKKLLSMDIVELNPKYDIDHCTARLAARLIYFIMNSISSH